MFKKGICFLSIFLIFSLFNIERATRVHAQEKIAYLTFDDGPTHNTEKLLVLLNQYEIDATFFVVGNQITPKRATLLKDLIKQGHYIGLHTMTHDFNMLYGHKESMNTFIKEIQKEQELIYQITGLRSFLVRPPYSNGSVITNRYIDAIKSHQFKLWDWTVDSRDWEAKTTHDIIDKVLSDIYYTKHKNMLVILFHETDLTLEALPSIIELLKERGYSFKAYDPKHHIPVNFKQDPEI